MRLMTIHICSKQNMSEGTIFAPFVGALVPAFLPIGQMLLCNSVWGKYNRVVNRTTCRCGCWDTFYKGSYEIGIANYKHIYFNATSNTLKIWVSTVVAIVLLYECVCRIIRLCQARSLRISMLVLFCSSVYSHYYAWWMLFNYWNDDYYNQWYHQLLFTFTELVATSIVVNLLDSKIDVTPWKLVIIASVCTGHFVTSMYDQFAENVLSMEGQMHQVLRDIGFMCSDILHICIPLWELKTLAKKFRLPITFLITKSMAVMGILTVLSIWSISTFL